MGWISEGWLSSRTSTKQMSAAIQRAFDGREARSTQRMAGVARTSWKRNIRRSIPALMCVLSTLYAIDWTVADAREPLPVAREPYFGHYGIDCSVPKTDPDPLAPAHVPAKLSPPPESYSELVEKFISASKKGDKNALRGVLDNQYHQTTHSGSCIAATKSLSERCAREPAYLLGDLEIRVAWNCHRRSQYDEFFTISNGRISTIWSIDETTPLPVMVRSSDGS